MIMVVQLDVCGACHDMSLAINVAKWVKNGGENCVGPQCFDCLARLIISDLLSATIPNQSTR